jgi:hypothetical protein
MFPTNCCSVAGRPRFKFRQPLVFLGLTLDEFCWRPHSLLLFFVSTPRAPVKTTGGFLFQACRCFQYQNVALSQTFWEHHPTFMWDNIRDKNTIICIAICLPIKDITSARTHVTALELDSLCSLIHVAPRVVLKLANVPRLEIDCEMVVVIVQDLNGIQILDPSPLKQSLYCVGRMTEANG